MSVSTGFFDNDGINKIYSHRKSRHRLTGDGYKA
jgi:hypothetical protein